jgi:hypothetical protein
LDLELLGFEILDLEVLGLEILDFEILGFEAFVDPGFGAFGAFFAVRPGVALVLAADFFGSDRTAALLAR